MQPLSGSSLCVSLLAAFRAELWGSVAGESQVHSTVYSVFPCCFKSLKRKRKKETNSSGAQRRAQSRGTRGECSLVLFFIGKAGFQESEDDREEEQNLAIEQVGQCSCSWDCCVLVPCVDVG